MRQVAEEPHGASSAQPCTGRHLARAEEILAELED
jgi:hypothetical protein